MEKQFILFKQNQEKNAKENHSNMRKQGVP